MKIAITSPFGWPYVRRGNRFAHDLAGYLANKGHQVHYITIKPGRAEMTKMRGRVSVQYNRLNPYPMLLLRKIHSIEMFIPSCLRALLRGDFDIVQTIWPPDAFAASLNKSLKGTPFVHLLVDSNHFHLPTTFGRPMLARVLKTASRLEVPSHYVNDELRKAFGITGEMIPMTVDTGQFTPCEQKDLSHPRILCTSSFLDPRKRIDLLARAFDMLIEHVPHAVLQLSGHAPQSNTTATRTLLQSVKPQTRRAIEILGVGRLEDMPSLYRDASVTVLPSLSEAFGMVILESLASGTPVVGTRSGAIPEVLNEPRVGVLFEPTGGPRELCEALLKGLELAQDPQTPRRCRQHAERYSWDTIGPRYEKLFLEVLNGNKRKTGRTPKKNKTEEMDSFNVSSQRERSQATTDKRALNKVFDDALDELEITHETYNIIDQYRPRCLYILNWLLANKIQKGNVLVVSEYSRPLTMLLGRLGFMVKGISVTRRLDPRQEVENRMLLSEFEMTRDISESYDLIICDDLLQHFVYPIRVLRMLREQLKAEGVFILGTPNVAKGTARLLLLMGRSIYPWLEDDMFDDGSSLEEVQRLLPYREYTLREAERIATSSGFEVIHSQRIIGRKLIVDGWSPVPLRTYLFQKIYYLVQKIAPPLRSHFFVAGRKAVIDNKTVKSDTSP